MLFGLDSAVYTNLGMVFVICRLDGSPSVLVDAKEC